jgi:diacylglycerol kinase family enzyme
MPSKMTTQLSTQMLLTTGHHHTHTDDVGEVGGLYSLFILLASAGFALLPNIQRKRDDADGFGRKRYIGLNGTRIMCNLERAPASPRRVEGTVGCNRY